LEDPANAVGNWIENMKTDWKVCRAVVGGVLMAPMAVCAQSVDGISTETTAFVGRVAQGHPLVTAVLLVMGAMRVVFKPVMTLLDSYIKSHRSAEDYARLQAFETGPVYRWICFALDFFGSIKLPVAGIKPFCSSSTDPAQ
jgi:hypothetical protein